MKKPLTNLRVLRLCQGMTLQEVSSLLGISCQSLQSIELQRKKPGYEVMCKLETLFGKPHNELLAKANNRLSPNTTIPS